MAEKSRQVKNTQKIDRNDFIKSIKNNYQLYLLILPVMAYFIIFFYWPMYGVQIAFKNFNPALGITGSPFSGFNHFERFFNGFYFSRVIKNTIGISLYSIIIGIPAPIILALMFNELKLKKFKTIVQTISFAPNFLSMVVVVGLVFFFLSPTNGIINAIRMQLFDKEPILYLGEAKYFWHIYVWSGVWQTVGWGSIIYTASMSGIPNEQYEAAIIDGARRFQRIRHITIPGIMPTIIIISLMTIGRLMNVGFEKTYLLQNNMNLENSEIIATYVYKSGIINAQYSYSAAVGLFNNVVNFVILISMNALSKKVGETSLW